MLNKTLNNLQLFFVRKICKHLVFWRAIGQLDNRQAVVAQERTCGHGLTSTYYVISRKHTGSLKDL